MIKPEHINKFQDFWTPNDPEKDITLRKRLMVNEKASERKAHYFAGNHPRNIKVPPTIEIKLIKNKLAAEVQFFYFDPAYSDPNEVEVVEYIYNLVGPVDDVYRAALKVSSKIGIGYERNFNVTWNKTILAVVNKPSEGKSMLNLGTYQPKDKFGLYDLKTPSQLFISLKLLIHIVPTFGFLTNSSFHLGRESR